MEEQEKTGDDQLEQTRIEQASSIPDATIGTSDDRVSHTDETTSLPNVSQDSVSTKRPLRNDNYSDASNAEGSSNNLTSSSTPAASDAGITNSDTPNKRFKSDYLAEGPETPPTPTTHTTSQSSQTSHSDLIKTSIHSDANFSIVMKQGASDQPPPTPPPSAASTATNSSSIDPPESKSLAKNKALERRDSMPSAKETINASSPMKQTSSSFDTGRGWTDDDAYERMPKTPVAPAQTSSMRKNFQYAMSPTFGGNTGVYLPDVPPAPPTTPATKSSVLPFPVDMGLATPLPYTGGFVQNARQLEQLQRQSQKNKEKTQQQQQQQQPQEPELPEGAATPAPPRSQQQEQTNRPKPSSVKPTLADDFSEWAVGERYKLCRMLGRGSYGEVAQAIDLYQGRPDAFVAIKRIVGPFDQEVDAVRLFREIHILRRLRTLGSNDCIVPLLDVVQPPSDDLNDFHDLYLVFDYVDTDLYKLIMSPQYLTTEHIQTFLYQMLIGLKYIHSGNVIHRDLKPANILLNEDCSLKICDFGLARIVDEVSVARSNGPSNNDDSSAPTEGEISPKRTFGRSCSVSEEMLSRAPLETPPERNKMVSKLPLTRQLTKHVVTRWYRAPELILIQPYTTAVDVWSLGCIFAELLSMQEGSVPGYQDRTPLFPGGACYPLSGDADNSERLDQLNVIFNVIGTPSEKDIANIGTANEYIKNMKPIKPKKLKDIYPAADPNALDLLEKMLKFNPKERCTAGEALDHKFFLGIRREEMESSVQSPMESPAFLNAQEIDIETLKQKTYNEVLWFRDNQSKPNVAAAAAAAAQTLTPTQETSTEPGSG